jgi:hypothetical protein
MGAYFDHTEEYRILNGWRKPQPKGFGADRMMNNSWLMKDQMVDDTRKSWAVCPHLSSLEGLFDYYMASGSIMVLLGKCFCHACYKTVLSKRDLKQFMDSCEHMTDKRFQEDFIDPLVQINRQIFKARRNLTGTEMSRWTWVGCSHVVKAEQLEGLYTSCNPIFFHEGVVTCNECKDIIPSASLYLQTLMECEAMTDDQLHEGVINLLYPINREVLEAVGHYRR